MTEFKQGCCSHNFCAKGCGRQNMQLNTYDYLADIPGNESESDFVEVQFKNTRKGYFRNDNHLSLAKGDVVAVESNPGHDIGTVTLTGRLVQMQMKRGCCKQREEVKRVYRIAKDVDIEKYEEAKSREQQTMIRTRQIAIELGLDMKISDVEYQGDGNKAIFYYIADGRVDFRRLIRVLAETFHVRIEMKQIGSRQEAGRVGGIGPCGRELCCATWMTNFSSVSTTAARFQDVSLNPQRLAGQCAKLKCCLNYEVDTYTEALRKMPGREITLETADATYYHFKSDILANTLTYSTDRRLAANLVTITAERAKEVIRLNKEGDKPISLSGEIAPPPPPGSKDLVEQESLTRFDNARSRKNKGKRNNRNSERGGAPRAARQGGPRPERSERPERSGNRQEHKPAPASDNSVPQQAQ